MVRSFVRSSFRSTKTKPTRPTVPGHSRTLCDPRGSSTPPRAPAAHVTPKTLKPVFLGPFNGFCGLAPGGCRQLRRSFRGSYVVVVRRRRHPTNQTSQLSRPTALTGTHLGRVCPRSVDFVPIECFVGNGLRTVVRSSFVVVVTQPTKPANLTRPTAPTGPISGECVRAR